MVQRYGIRICLSIPPLGTTNRFSKGLKPLSKKEMEEIEEA
jgi:hypothetical protein